MASSSQRFRTWRSQLSGVSEAASLVAMHDIIRSNTRYVSEPLLQPGTGAGRLQNGRIRERDCIRRPLPNRRASGSARVDLPLPRKTAGEGTGEALERQDA